MGEFGGTIYLLFVNKKNSLIGQALSKSRIRHCFCSLQIFVSNKWGFTKWNREDYKEMRQSGKLTTDGVGVQYRPEKGPLSEWKNRMIKL